MTRAPATSPPKIMGSSVGTITNTASSLDANYDGIAIPDVNVSVTDDDTAGITIVESGGSTDVAEEGPTSDTYTLVLTSEPTANVIVTVTPDAETDLGSGAGVAVDLTFTNGDWDTAQTVTVTAQFGDAEQGLVNEQVESLAPISAFDFSNKNCFTKAFTQR